MTPSLRKLWSITGVDPTQSTEEWNGYFDPVGLILINPPHNWGYWCTPKNSITFATTGGDGVHYGLLDIGRGIVEESPVVMTVPMSDEPNMVVGQSLAHFLHIGLETGYFVLEQLVHQAESPLEHVESEDELELLKEIQSGFSLKTAMIAETEIARVHSQYFHQVITNGDPE